MSIEGKGDATLTLNISEDLAKDITLQFLTTDEEVWKKGVIAYGKVEPITVRGYLRLREEGEEVSVLFFVEAGSGRVLFEVVPDIKIIGILR